MTDDRAAGEIVFESWDGAGAEAVWAALGPARHWTAVQGRTYLGADRDGERFRRVRVMRDGSGAVVGVLAVSDNAPLHPVYLNAYVEIAADRRGEGFGRAGLERLRLLAALDGRSVKGKAEFESAGHRFLVASGFTEVQRTLTLRLDAALLPAARESYDIDVHPSGDAAPDACVEAWQDRYLATHQWSPAVRLPLAQARQQFTALPARIRTGSRRGALLRLALVADDDVQRCATDPYAPDGAEIVRALIRAAAEVAGTPALLAEVDDAMAATVLAALPLAVSVEDDSRIAVSLPIPDLRAVPGGPVHLD